MEKTKTRVIDNVCMHVGMSSLGIWYKCIYYVSLEMPCPSPHEISHFAI